MDTQEQMEKEDKELELKADVEVKLYKLIAYLEILREEIGLDNYLDKLNSYYHGLGPIRYKIKQLLGHPLVGNSYIVRGDEL